MFAHRVAFFLVSLAPGSGRLRTHTFVLGADERALHHGRPPAGSEGPHGYPLALSKWLAGKVPELNGDLIPKMVFFDGISRDFMGLCGILWEIPSGYIKIAIENGL